MPAGNPKYFQNGAQTYQPGQSPVAKKSEETSISLIPKGGLFALDEQTDLGMGLLLRPVQTSLKKFNLDLSGIFGSSGSGATSETQTAEERQDEQINRAADAIRGVSNLGQIASQFTAKLTSAPTSKEYGEYIWLPLPLKIMDSLSVNYSGKSLGGFAAGYSLGQDVSERIQGSGSLGDPAQSAASYAIRAALGAVPGVGDAATAFLGNVPNPFAANIFENVDQRGFSFEFNLQPKSPEESNNIRQIINTLRLLSLPKPSDDGLLLEVPWEWELAFVDTEYLFAFSRCALTRIAVNYSPSGAGAVFFAGTDAPKDITLDLEFREIFPLNQKTITSFNSASMNPNLRSGDSVGTAEAIGVDPETGEAPESADASAKKLDTEIATTAKQYSDAFNQWAAAVAAGNAQEAERYKITINELRDQFNSLVDEAGGKNAAGVAYKKLTGLP